jgi:hypothetical protein
LLKVGLSSGLLPDQFWGMTFREVAYYTSGILENEKLEWRRHSYLLALLANQHRPKGKAPAKADDFYPFEVEKPEFTKEDIESVIEHLKRPRKQKT